MPRAFISRAFDETPDLEVFLKERGFEIEARSMIRREFIPFTLPDIKSHQWLFFSSPFAVKAWFEQGGVSGKLAAIGEGTANILSQYGEVLFCGSSSNTSETANEFAAVANNFPVIFPSAEKGMRQIQKTFKPEQYLEIICYRTLPRPVLVEKADLYIFSSPSNVHSFFKLNSISSDSVVVSYGPSSTKALLEYQQSNVFESAGTGLPELIKAISSALER